ncbi:thioredoxin peroxidase [Photobacterium aquae]|uniref:Thioredoxin peroxidase n=1 Tax=Photobacterium aquae TaxID=1195763 RepID=A0A0J1H173_9GAMM|nr:peroxiredoxin-like family protein [Photobacterium aquae]KLV05539.1 thioredoxin peroxidase [Photobacterium aquae]
MTSGKLKAGSIFPAIALPTLTGTDVILGVPQQGTDWQMVVIYRGRHCPLCTRYLNELETLREQFGALGIDIVVASADSEEQLRTHMDNLSVSFPIGYGLNIEQMQQLGLYISHPRSAQETDHPFAEPGLFVINENNEIQIIDISNAPFARPDLKTLLAGLAFIRNPENNYPIRGTYL